MSRRWSLGTGCLLVALALSGCRQVITRNPPPPPPFPPEYESVITLRSGLILRASGEVLSQGPTTVRITVTLENPTTEDIRAFTLTGDCQMLIAGFWAQNSEGQLLQPFDGRVDHNGQSVMCEQFTGFLDVAAGETVDLSKEEDLVVSQVLGDDFVPGRHILTAVFIDDFFYQALALDVFIDD